MKHIVFHMSILTSFFWVSQATCPPTQNTLNVITTIFACQAEVDRASCIADACPMLLAHQDCTSTAADLVTASGGDCATIANQYYAYECDYSLSTLIEAYCSAVRCPSGAQDVQDMLVLVDCGFLPELEGVVQGSAPVEASQDSKCLADRGACGPQSSSTMLRFSSCNKSIRQILEELFQFYEQTPIACELIMSPASRCNDVLGRELTENYCTEEEDWIYVVAGGGGVVFVGSLATAFFIMKRRIRRKVSRNFNFVGNPNFRGDLQLSPEVGKAQPTPFTGRSRLVEKKSNGIIQDKEGTLIWKKEAIYSDQRAVVGKPTSAMMK